MHSHSLEIDLFCVQCGYNLRTRTARDRCPECGTIVSMALVAWPMRERQRVSRISRATAAIAALNSVVILCAAIMFWHRYFDSRKWWIDTNLPEFLFRYFAAYSTLVVGAVWSLTNVSLTGLVHQTGQWIRWSSICLAVAHIVPSTALYVRFFDTGLILFWLILLPSASVLSQQLGVFFEEICWSCNFSKMGRGIFLAEWVLAVSLVCWEVTGLGNIFITNTNLVLPVNVLLFISGGTALTALAVATGLQWFLCRHLLHWMG